MIFKTKSKIKEYYNSKKKYITIYIEKINIMAKTIVDLLDEFEVENIIVITYLKKDSALFKKIEKDNIKYTTTFQRKENPYVEIILLLPIDYFEIILNDVLLQNPETIFIYNKKNVISWEQYLFNNKYFQHNGLVNKITDLHFEFILNECEISISYDTEIYNSEKTNSKIKQIISKK